MLERAKVSKMNKTTVESMIKAAIDEYWFYSTEWINGNDTVEGEMLLWQERIDLLEKLLTTFQ